MGSQGWGRGAGLRLGKGSSEGERLWSLQGMQMRERMGLGLGSKGGEVQKLALHRGPEVTEVN